MVNPIISTSTTRNSIPIGDLPSSDILSLWLREEEELEHD